MLIKKGVDRPGKYCPFFDLYLADSGNHSQQGQENDIEIRGEGVIINIEQIKAHLIGHDVLQIIIKEIGAVELFFFIPIQNRGGAGHPGADAEDFFLNFYNYTIFKQSQSFPLCCKM